MAEIGLFLSSEEHGPRALVGQARRGEEVGFSSVLISDHSHPWLEAQGESPFVWSVIGAIASSTSLKVTTGVSCPTLRTHPAILAQAAATAQLLLDGRFVFGVGSGEALNEHILGDRWPPIGERLDMLEEAVLVMRELWTGALVNHDGPHYTVENARLYSCPDRPPPVYVSAFGPQALEVAARVGDGLITTSPDAEVVANFREQGGLGPAVGGVKICWSRDESQARKTVHRLWPTECLPGQLNQELALPSYFEAATELVTEDMVADVIPCGPDPDRHAAAINRFVEAGFEEIYVNQVGEDQEGFFSFYENELRDRLVA
jgi:G6PDH family F420-dependent oxidoreductase